jgi:hypothetical protein
MHSAIESAVSNQDSPPNGRAGTFRLWNRKLHYYLGLYLLFFVWLFSFSGLLLNHSSWKFAEFWDSRKQTTVEHPIIAPEPGDDLAQARQILRQLGLSGEIEWTSKRADPNQFDFRVSRPGHIVDIKADFGQNRAQIQQIDLNTWGVMRILHTFTGVRANDSRNTRDWFLTSVWALAMDAVAAGLILMVLSSVVMWLELPRKRWLGLGAVGLGFLSCGLFCVALRWLY